MDSFLSILLKSKQFRKILWYKTLALLKPFSKAILSITSAFLNSPLFDYNNKAKSGKAR